MLIWESHFVSGLILGISGKFFNLGRIGTWWSSTDAGYLDSACCRNLHDNSNAFSEISHPKHEGLSIRCLKD